MRAAGRASSRATSSTSAAARGATTTSSRPGRGRASCAGSGLEPDAARAARCGGGPVGARCAWREAEALDDVARFDHALVLRSWNHLRDPDRAAAAIVRALRPGGTLLVVDNVAFGLLRAAPQEHGERSSDWEHYRNDDAARAHAVLSGLPSGAARAAGRVAPDSSNQWLLATDALDARLARPAILGNVAGDRRSGLRAARGARRARRSTASGTSTRCSTSAAWARSTRPRTATGAARPSRCCTPSFARDPEVRERFLREGYVANKIEHPGAVAILDDDIAEDGVAVPRHGAARGRVARRAGCSASGARCR